MKITFLRESDPGETRRAVSPESVATLSGLGASVVVESGIGEPLGWADQAFADAGAAVESSADALLAEPAWFPRVQAPDAEAIARMPSGSIYAGFLDPFNRGDLISAFSSAGVSAFSMEMVPRTTRAQKLDALSSQHSIAGYYMVVLAAERLGKAVPMMATPSGVIHPARVLVIGAGVAGLQAIATAKRLGARIEAFDTRPAVKEQVESLGAKFIDIDLGETGEQGGYAKELTPEQQAKQREGMVKALERADIVITTAALFGRPAPVVITDDMLRRMSPGSLIVDYAVATGGNVEGSVAGEDVTLHGVRVMGLKNYPGRVAVDATRMYANNIAGLAQIICDKEAGAFKLDREDDIVAGALITHGGEIVNERIRELHAASA